MSGTCVCTNTHNNTSTSTAFVFYDLTAKESRIMRTLVLSLNYYIKEIVLTVRNSIKREVSLYNTARPAASRHFQTQRDGRIPSLAKSYELVIKFCIIIW